LGKRLDSKSLSSLAELVSECWHQDPKSRPTLSDITLRARKLLTELGDASTEGGSSKKANKSVLKELARDGHGAESVYDLGRDATPSGVTDSIYAEIDSQTRRPRAADALQYQNLLRGVEVGEVIGEGEVPVFPAAASIPISIQLEAIFCRECSLTFVPSFCSLGRFFAASTTEKPSP
jgi:hypothetical protein